MMGYCRIPPHEGMKLTLRALVVMYESAMVADWDHTALISVHLHNLSALVHNIASKGKKIKPQTFEDMHPFRTAKPKGYKVNADNIDVLRELASGLMRRR